MLPYIRKSVKKSTASIKMNKSLVSICIPAYNSFKYIDATLASIKKQTYKKWELIVVEDASNDGTESVVKEFSQKVPQKVVYVRNEQSKGPGGARNVAATLAKGDWIAFLDSDDLWYENHLSELIRTSIARPECSLIHSGVEVFNSESGEIIYREQYATETTKKFPLSLFDRSYGFQPSQVMLSTELFFKTGGFNETFRYAEDLELWFRCARIGARFAISEENTCSYRQNNSTALTSNTLGMALGSANVYEQYVEWKTIPKNVRRKIASEAWLSAARIARKTNKKISRECVSKSIKHNLTLKVFLYYLIIRLPPFKSPFK
jgi:glycosyltransferase involved in cell wall biosynthesis